MPATLLLPLLLIAAAASPAVDPGDWDIRSTVVDLTIPGVPGFLQRMALGKSKSERKRLTAGQGIEALLAPDPKARCRIDSQRVADGRYAQMLVCPQRQGEPMHIDRTGTYDSTGFVGRASVAGATPKGPIAIILDQRAVHVKSR